MRGFPEVSAPAVTMMKEGFLEGTYTAVQNLNIKCSTGYRYKIVLHYIFNLDLGVNIKVIVLAPLE